MGSSATKNKPKKSSHERLWNKPTVSSSNKNNQLISPANSASTISSSNKNNQLISPANSVSTKSGKSLHVSSKSIGNRLWSKPTVSSFNKRNQVTPINTSSPPLTPKKDKSPRAAVTSKSIGSRLWSKPTVSSS